MVARTGSPKSEFVAYVVDLLAPAGSASSRAMFGGYGVYIESQIIAIVIDDTLYLKADDVSCKLFEERGLEPFSYTSKGKTYAMSYFRAPEEALDSAQAMLPWAREALAAALRKAAGKASPKKKPPGKAQPKPKSLTSRKR
jgi:DNA transformation protein